MSGAVGNGPRRAPRYDGPPSDAGFRIDHLLLSPIAADRLRDAGVDKDYRGREKASDHAPTWVRLR